MTDPPERWLELRNGQAVPLEYPKMGHYGVRGNIIEALHDAYRGKGMAGQVLPFRSRDEQRVRVADVAWISKEQMRRARIADDVFGSPSRRVAWSFGS